MKKKWIYLAVPLLALLLMSVWYINDYYHSDESIQQYFSQNSNVSISEIKDGLFLDGPGTESALIFYPGAKVEYTAYLPLFYRTAEQGTDVFLLEMPCNLAFLGRNRADQILETYDYNHWYLSGHSLGGAMAADYCADNTDHLDGLILLAAYPTKSLRTEGFSALSIYGSEDHVLNMEKNSCRKTLPKYISLAETMPNSETMVYRKGTAPHPYQQTNSRHRLHWPSAI